MLYGLCEKYPHHETLAGVTAKIVFINRAYSAGLERCIKPALGEQAIMLAIAYILEHRADVDDIVAQVRQATEPLDADGMQLIVEQHGRLLNLLADMPACKKLPRSFAAKYLHFHHPAVPDLRQLRAQWSWTPECASKGTRDMAWQARRHRR